MIFCVLRWTWSFVFVFLFVCIYVLCFCAATDFSVNKGLYNETPQEGVKSPYRDTTMAVGWLVGWWKYAVGRCNAETLSLPNCIVISRRRASWT